MKIGGFQELTLIDYPGKVASLVFTVGCNFRCKYCYNIDLLSDEYFNKSDRKEISEDYILKFVEDHSKMIDAVAITGGNPLIQYDLPLFCQKIKWLNKNVKIDTNGSNPEMLEKLITKKLVDYVAMDLKAPLDKYKQITSYDNSENITKSINILKNSGIPHEFRMTLYPELTKDDICRAIDLIPGETIYLQNFEPAHAYSEDARNLKALSKELIEQIAEEKKSVANVHLRGF